MLQIKECPLPFPTTGSTSLHGVVTVKFLVEIGRRNQSFCYLIYIMIINIMTITKNAFMLFIAKNFTTARVGANGIHDFPFSV